MHHQFLADREEALLENKTGQIVEKLICVNFNNSSPDEMLEQWEVNGISSGKKYINWIQILQSTFLIQIFFS